MARNRQRAKERQAERRAAREAAGKSAGNPGAVPESQYRSEAPPEELGRPDYTLEHTNEEEEFIGHLHVQEPGEPDELAPRGGRGGREHEAPPHRERGRVAGVPHAG